MTRDTPDAASVLLATRSADKAREIREISQVRFITLDEAGVKPDPAEDRIEIFETFLDNAHAKAAYFLRLTGLPTIADDSGIRVDALDGAPGVHSRRFASGHALSGLEQDRANNERLLHRLRKTPIGHRAAHYTCAAVLHTPNGRRFSALGTCSGLILHEARGDGGFGYDPLFLLPDTGLTFGEMSRAEKQRRSHRSRAFRALAVAASLLDHSASLR